MTDAEDRSARWRAAVRELTERRASYDPSRQNYYNDIVRRCLAIIEPYGDILDVGCGEGSMWHHLRKAGMVRTYHGIDPGLTAARGSGNMTMEPGIAEALPVPDGSVDTVLLYSVLTQVEYPAQALAEAYRVIRPGGRLSVQSSVNESNSLFLNCWTPDALVALIESAGFVIEAQHLLTDSLLCVRGTKMAA